jgi:hypothetical protein
MGNRITVPVSDEGYEIARRLAELNDTSMGKVLAEVVQMAIPSLGTILGAFDAAKAMEQDERDEFVRSLAQHERSLLAAVGHATGELPPSANYDAARTPRSPSGRGGGRADPPILTGGFPTSKKGGKP